MSNLFDSEFKVSSYLDAGKSEEGKTLPNIDPKKVEEAIQWSIDDMKYIITPALNLDELETMWLKWNSMKKDNRRRSDWKALELFGLTNKEFYDIQKNRFLGEDIGNYSDRDRIDNISSSDIGSMSESGIIDGHDLSMYYDTEVLNYSPLDVQRAIEWGKESNRVIIVPTRTLVELESLWDAYNAMIKKHRRESDWKSQELFGVTNLKHYEFLKTQFLRDDISRADEDRYGSVVESSQFIIRDYLNREIKNDIPFVEVAKTILEMNIPSNSIYEELLTGNILSSVMGTYDGLTDNTPGPDYTYGDLPMIDPEDMINLGVYNDDPEKNMYHVLADNSMLNDEISVKEWFDLYRNTCMGFECDFRECASDWVNKVRYLTSTMSSIKDEAALNARKQSILELGWNPDVEFTPEIRSIVSEIGRDRIAKSKSYPKVIDLREFTTTANRNMLLEDSISTSTFKPVYIVLTEGKSLISGPIKKFTHDVYTHASIAFDSTLKKMYSFGINGSEKGLRGGFIEEDVKDTPEGCVIGVYVMFVSDKILNGIKNIIENLKNNISKTSYSYRNLIGCLFNSRYSNNLSMVCSQFVDNTLKMVGIDITNKYPSTVRPTDIRQVADKNDRIYRLYSGLADRYSQSDVASTVRALTTKAKPIKEANEFYFVNEKSYLQGLVSNIRDVSTLLEMRSHLTLISNTKLREFVDYYIFEPLEIKPFTEGRSSSLKLKDQYDECKKDIKKCQKSDDINGVKDCLAKMWSLKAIADKELNSDKYDHLPSMAIETSEPARVSDAVDKDFEEYIKYILGKDHSFNFEEYYKQSEYYTESNTQYKPSIDLINKIIREHMMPI